MGTKSWVLKRTAKRGSQNWVEFFKKKRISHYVFACFVQMGSKFGVLLSTRQHIYIYIYAKDLIWWADFRLQDVEKQRERRKTKAKKAERRKKKKLGNMKTPTFLWGFFLANFNYKTGEKLRFLTKMCPPVGVSPIYIYTYIYIYMARSWAFAYLFGV